MDFQKLSNQIEITDKEPTGGYFIIEINDQGEVNYEAVNFTGKACDAAAQDLIKALDGDEVDGKRKNKATYSQVQRTTSTQQVRKTNNQQRLGQG